MHLQELKMIAVHLFIFPEFKQLMDCLWYTRSRSLRKKKKIVFLLLTICSCLQLADMQLQFPGNKVWPVQIFKMKSERRRHEDTRGRAPRWPILGKFQPGAAAWNVLMEDSFRKGWKQIQSDRVFTNWHPPSPNMVKSSVDCLCEIETVCPHKHTHTQRHTLGVSNSGGKGRQLSTCSFTRTAERIPLHHSLCLFMSAVCLTHSYSLAQDGRTEICITSALQWVQVCI